MDFAMDSLITQFDFQVIPLANVLSVLDRVFAVEETYTDPQDWLIRLVFIVDIYTQ